MKNGGEYFVSKIARQTELARCVSEKSAICELLHNTYARYRFTVSQA